MNNNIQVGILGATGLVGQQLILLLKYHPQFNINTLGASSRNVGKKYNEIIIDSDINLKISPCEPQYFKDCDLIFSCLHSEGSFLIEKEFLDNNYLIFSNCSNYRLNPQVSLVVPTVNYDLLYKNLENKDKLKIITNANCSTTGIVTILKPLDTKFKIKKVILTTLQAISGAGKYFDDSINNNIIPYIKNEEEKIKNETLKILNKNNEDFAISATCNRVDVKNGHTVCMSIKFDKKVTILEVKECLKNYNEHLLNTLNTYSSINKNFIEIIEEENRPQPILDINNSNGFCVTVGRIRECDVFDIKLTLHFNNIILGAAGSALLNAEIYFNKIN